MMISISAASVDFAEFSWYTNKGEPFVFDPGNGQVALKVDTGDWIGLKKTTRGPTAGQYQAILQKYPHKIYRSIVPAAIEKHLDDLKPYNGIPPRPEKSGKRYTKVKIKGAGDHDKQTAEKYKPVKAPKEEGEYDKSNYQWRKVVNGPLPVVTHHYGKPRPHLKNGDVIGLRFMTTVKGGFIIMPSGERVNISEAIYDNITAGTRILPHAEQQVGVVVLEDIKHLLPKHARIRPARRVKKESESELEFEEDDDSEIDEKAQARRGRNFIAKHNELVSDFEYIEDDTLDYEDDDEDEQPLEYEEDEDDEEENVKDEEFQGFEEGMILQALNGAEFVIAAIEETGMSDTLFLYDRNHGNIKFTKVPIGLDIRQYDKAKIVGRVKENELVNIKHMASRIIERKRTGK